jgi:hypothetical protein
MLLKVMWEYYLQQPLILYQIEQNETIAIQLWK